MCKQSPSLSQAWFAPTQSAPLWCNKHYSQNFPSLSSYIIQPDLTTRVEAGGRVGKTLSSFALSKVLSLLLVS